MFSRNSEHSSSAPGEAPELREASIPHNYHLPPLFSGGRASDPWINGGKVVVVLGKMRGRTHGGAGRATESRESVTPKN